MAPELYVPCGFILAGFVKPVGSVSVITTFVAAAEPTLRTVIVYFTTSPGSTKFVSFPLTLDVLLSCRLGPTMTDESRLTSLDLVGAEPELLLKFADAMFVNLLAEGDCGTSQLKLTVCVPPGAHCRTWNMARKLKILENEKHPLDD